MNDSQKLEMTHNSIVNALLYIDKIKDNNIKEGMTYTQLSNYLKECTGLISELITIEENNLEDILDKQQSFLGSTIKGILRKLNTEDERMDKIKHLESYIIDDVFYYITEKDSEIITIRDLAMSPYITKK